MTLRKSGMYRMHYHKKTKKLRLHYQVNEYYNDNVPSDYLNFMKTKNAGQAAAEFIKNLHV